MTELELREAIKAIIERWHLGKPMVAAIDAIHAARKRHPIEWPEAKP